MAFPLRWCSVLFLAGISAFAQDSSSNPSHPAPSASPSPTSQTEVRSGKRRNIPEVEDAIAKGEQLLFKKHDAKASIDEFKRAIKLDPWFGHSYMLLGLARMQLGEWTDAQWAFTEAEKVEPANAQAYLGEGSALNEQKNYADAQKALERSLELVPNSPEAHYELGRSLWGAGKWEAAEPHVRRAIELNKDYAGPHALLGNVFIQQEEPESALVEFQEYLRLDPHGSLAPQAQEMVEQIKRVLDARK